MPFDGLFEKMNKAVEPITIESFRGENKPFLIACFGAGRDSVGGIIKFAQMGIRPEILPFDFSGLWQYNNSLRTTIVLTPEF